jgi:serine/threonine-protein kinase
VPDSTLVTPSIGLDETVASTTAPGSPSGSGSFRPVDSASPRSALFRSTVLPRVEMVGTTPRLVSQGKPRYEHTRRLGEGGLGEVLGARDNDIDRDVAVKRLRPEVASPATLARFVEEVRTIGRLEHPNIIPIHDVGVDEGGEYYFVMKYIDGETLESIIDKLAAGDADTHARYGFERRVQIFTALVEAVAFAHQKGIVHRDIKPANVMVGAYGEVVLMDWGIAKQLRSAADNTLDAPAAPTHAGHAKRGSLFETIAGQIVGTPAYMSPEQARGERVDARTDVYSLCLLFHELLCLRHPFADKETLTQMVLAVTTEPTPLTSFVRSEYQPPVPADLGWFVKKGVAKDPAERYSSAAEMLDRLARRAEGDIPVQCPITFQKKLSHLWSRFADRHPMVTLVAALAVFAVFFAGIVSLVRHAG